MAEPLTAQTADEERALTMMRIRSEFPPDRKINKKWKRGRVTLGFDWGARTNFWGRFGGGWNWKLGFTAGSWRSVRFHLLVCDVSFHLAKKPNAEKASGR